MIIRIVKMVLLPERVKDFEALFAARKEKIRTVPGCRHLELLRGSGRENLFFTYSYWENETDLDQYRASGFFKDTWSQTKLLFAEKAEAWSLEQKYILP
jgi:heme-degrading monooxygenase HmoA